MGADVSVIIATYNVERYIERAVNSALNQEGVAVEVIIVDDVSTDNTWSIVSGMTDPRIKCFRLSKNGGPGAARNAGIATASGTWIAVLDSDDQFLPGRLRRCIHHAEMRDADIVVDNIRVTREEDGSEFPMFPLAVFPKLKQLELAVFIKGTLPRSTNNYTLGYLKPVFSLDCLRRYTLTYDSGLKIGEDYMLMVKALANGALCVVEPSTGYQYTARSGSISHRLSLHNISSMLEADAKFVANHTLAQDAAEEQRKRTRSLKKEYAYTALVDAIKQKDIAAAFKAVTSSPFALLLLSRPLGIRLRRLLKLFDGGW